MGSAAARSSTPALTGWWRLILLLLLVPSAPARPCRTKQVSAARQLHDASIQKGLPNVLPCSSPGHL
jgi:hypothetical protein